MPHTERNAVLISGVVSFFQIHVQREYLSTEDEEDDYLYLLFSVHSVLSFSLW